MLYGNYLLHSIHFLPSRKLSSNSSKSSPSIRRLSLSIFAERAVTFLSPPPDIENSLAFSFFVRLLEFIFEGFDYPPTLKNVPSNNLENVYLYIFLIDTMINKNKV